MLVKHTRSRGTLVPAVTAPDTMVSTGNAKAVEETPSQGGLCNELDARHKVALLRLHERSFFGGNRREGRRRQIGIITGAEVHVL